MPDALGKLITSAQPADVGAQRVRCRNERIENA
jgi:hypothetical protein